MICELQIRKYIEGKDFTANFKLLSKHFLGESIWMTTTVTITKVDILGVSKFVLCCLHLGTHYVVGNLLHI
jgi:hypothetical protein